MVDKGRIPDIIHDASLELLRSPGIRLHDGELLSTLKRHGVRVERDIAMFTEKDVVAALSSAPSGFMLGAADDNRSLFIGGNSRRMAGPFGAPIIVTADNRRRIATFDDYLRAIKLVHSADQVDINGGILVQPNDIEDGMDKLLMTRAALALTDKPLLGFQGSYNEVKQVMELASIAFGGDIRFRSSHYLAFLINTLSPLQIDSQALGTIRACAEYNQPLIITPAPVTGCTSPITTEGSIVQANAEFLAALCITQMLSPGLPVVYGCLSAQGDMRTGGVNVASPNRAAYMRYATWMADRYNLPNRGQGVITDAGQTSFQSGYEAMFTLNYSYANRTSLTIHCAGILAGFAAFSFEQFMIDLELMRIMERSMRECSFSEDAIALDVIRSAGPGGEFLTHPHTVRNCRTEPYISKIAPMKNDDPHHYLADLEANVAKRLDELERAYIRPEFDKSLQEAMDRYTISCGAPSGMVENIRRV